MKTIVTFAKNTVKFILALTFLAGTALWFTPI